MPTPKPEAKEKIKKLIERYEQVKRSHQRPTYDEANTRKDFIMPLFQALGWDIHNDVAEREVVEEADAIKGRVDYSFRINDIPQFLLEAKALKANLERPEWANQAVTYGWNKGIPWVVLTNFEKLKLFNSEWKVAEPKPNLDLSYQNYLEKFDYLWLLSKEASETNELDKLLSQFGITAKRVSVNEKLAEDLVRWRDILTRNLKQWNDRISVPEIEEAVQRILDRLIFIRVVEDRGIEEKILWQTFQKWEANKHQPNNFLRVLIPIFRNFDKKYNSNLFQTHLCEKLETEGDPFQKIIPELYGDRETGVKYRFDAIGADVLGSVYEQYLGHVQQREGEESKRKKQGIYYTPTYIVDYIIQNTLGVALKEKTLREAENIKVLDPACGSGSFLIKAFAVLDKHLKEEKAQRNAGPEIDFLRRFSILEENIYGVDLDPQAIEIARLNLMLKALVPSQRLPLLTEHMRVGNSLISGTEKELKKYFGKDYQNKKPFNWNEEFEEVFDQGGFDIIIGNPPYVRVDSIKREDKMYWKNIFDSSQGKYDLYYLFIEAAYRWLKKGGKCGFIVPNKFCAASSAKRLREIIFRSSSSCRIISVSNLEIFKDAANYPLIILLTKGDLLEKLEVGAALNLDGFSSKRMLSYILDRKTLDYLPSGVIPININQEQLNLTIKLIKQSDKLSDYLKTSEALRISKPLESSKVEEYEILKQYQFDRYTAIKKGVYISKNNLKKVTSPKSERYLNSQKEKIVIAEDALRITSTFDDKNRIPQGGVYFAVLQDERSSTKFFLALLNSKLLSFAYKTLFGGMHMGGGYLRYRTEFLGQLPIRKIDFDDKSDRHRHDELVKLADKMLKLNQDLQKCAKDSDGYRAIQAEIEKVDREIDQMVYKLYDLTPEEIEIVEGEGGGKNGN